MPLLAGLNNDSTIAIHHLPPEAVIFGQTPAMRDVRQKLERALKEMNASIGTF